MNKRLQVPIADETIWEYDTDIIINFAVSKLSSPKLIVNFNGLEYPMELDLAAILKAELLASPEKVLGVARQMKWVDIDPLRTETMKSVDNKIDLAENWELVKYDKIKVR